MRLLLASLLLSGCLKAQASAPPYLNCNRIQLLGMPQGVAIWGCNGGLTECIVTDRGGISCVWKN